MEKTKKELLEGFRRSNKVRREQLANKAGYKSGAEYLKYLLSDDVKAAKVSKPVKAKKDKMVGVFYVIDLLDASGSMSGAKYENSRRGIINGIEDMTKKGNITYSLFEFIEGSRELNKAVKGARPNTVNTSQIRFSGAIGGSTPLYWAVYEAINSVKPNKEDKVLINVYTDGGDNTKKEYLPLAAKLINKVQKDNFTITFVATPEDLAKIKRDINIDDSNTLAITNDGAGFDMAMTKTRVAKARYFAGASAGENVLTGFYKKGGKL